MKTISNTSDFPHFYFAYRRRYQAPANCQSFVGCGSGGGIDLVANCSFNVHSLSDQ